MVSYFRSNCFFFNDTATTEIYTRSLHDALPICVPSERITDCSASLGVPDSNFAVVGSGNNVLPIGRVGNGRHRVLMPLERSTDWSTSLCIPGSKIGRASSGEGAQIAGVGNELQQIGMSPQRTADCNTSIVIPDS